MNSSISEQSSERECNQYSITINHVNFFEITNTKQDFKNFFYEFCKSFVCAKESYANEKDFHYHVYCDFYRKHTQESVICMLVDCINYNNKKVFGVDQKKFPLLFVQKTKQANSYINYITKEDESPEYFGVDDQNFHLNYHIFNFVINNPRLNRSHKFCVRNQKNFPLIEAAWHNYWDNRIQLLPMSPVTISDPLNGQIDWRDRIVEWWNNCVEIKNSPQGWIHKTPQLYLYGPSGSGKTIFIKNLLQPYLKEKQVFKPTASKGNHDFAFQNYNELNTRVTWIEEYAEILFDLDTLKKFLAGETFMSPVKNKDSIEITNSNPVIITSQHRPPDDEAFDEEHGARLFIVFCGVNEKETLNATDQESDLKKAIEQKSLKNSTKSTNNSVAVARLNSTVNTNFSSNSTGSVLNKASSRFSSLSSFLKKPFKCPKVWRWPVHDKKLETFLTRPTLSVATNYPSLNSDFNQTSFFIKNNKNKNDNMHNNHEQIQSAQSIIMISNCSEQNVMHKPTEIHLQDKSVVETLAEKGAHSYLLTKLYEKKEKSKEKSNLDINNNNNIINKFQLTKSPQTKRRIVKKHINRDSDRSDDKDDNNKDDISISNNGLRRESKRGNYEHGSFYKSFETTLDLKTCDNDLLNCVCNHDFDDANDSFNEIFQMDSHSNKIKTTSTHTKQKCSSPYSSCSNVHMVASNFVIPDTQTPPKQQPLIQPPHKPHESTTQTLLSNSNNIQRESYMNGSMPMYENNKLVWTFEQTERLVHAYHSVPLSANNTRNWPKIREIAKLSNFALVQLQNKIKNLKKTNNLNHY